MNEPKDKKNPDHSIDPHAHTEHAMQAVDPDDDIPDDQRVTLHRIDPSGVDTRAKTLHAHDPDVQNEPPPIVRSLLPPAPPSMDIKAQYQVDGELSIVNHPAAYITTERGTTDTPAIPFFGDYSINRFRQKHAKEELPPNTTIYTIGSDARCDIHLPKADYPLVKPFHAYVKIQDGKVWILRDQGLVKISKKPGLAMEWRQIEPGEDIIEIIQRPDQKEGRTIESAFVQVIPDHQTLEENDRQNMKDTLRARVTKLTERLNQATEEFKTLIENGNPPADKLEQLSDEANDIAILINDLTKLETDHELVMDSTAIIARTKHLMHVTTELGDMLEAMVTISEGYKAIAQQKEDDKNAREVELRLGAAKWQVDVLHALPNEAPLLSRGDIQKIIDGGLPEKREVHHVFRCPVFTLKKNGEMTSEPMPMLIPSMDIGTHMVCHIELEPSSGAKPNSKNHIAPFAGKLFYEYEGGERVPYFQYLQPNILIKSTGTSAKKVPPPSETFRVTDDMSIYIGGYELKIDNRTHGFTYGSIKEKLLGKLGKPGIIDELFECIDDQTVTTWEQDAQAIRYLQSIIEEIEKSKLPEKEKQLFRDKYTEKYERITVKLIRKIQEEWQEEDPHPDSGHFQTLLLFAQAEDGYARGAQRIYAPDDTLNHEAERRVENYTKPHQKTLPASDKTILGRWRKRPARQQVEPDVNPTAALEVARFLEFGLIEAEQIEDLGKLTDHVYKILKVRKHFKKLDQDRSDLEEILGLIKLCNNLSMSDIFATEEIETRNLHIEVDMKPEGKAKEYLRKICIFQARKAFKRLKESSDPEHIRADEALITGLCVMGIIQKFELIDNVNEYMSQDQIDALIQQKRAENPSATDEDLKNELKTREANDLIREKLTKADAIEQKEKARARLEDDIRTAVQHAAIIHNQNMQARDNGITLELLQQMLPLAQVVFSPGLQKVMDDTIYDLHVGEIEHNAGKAHARATPTRLNWHRIFKEWTNRFQNGLRLIGRKALSSGENLEVMYQMVDHAYTHGYGEKEHLAQLHIELYRASKAKQYKSAALAAGPTNFDYIEQMPVHAFSSDEDRAFFESVKNEITAQKVEQLMNARRDAEEKLEKLKWFIQISRLYRLEPIVDDILKRMDLTPEEKALLQLDV